MKIVENWLKFDDMLLPKFVGTFLELCVLIIIMSEMIYPR